MPELSRQRRLLILAICCSSLFIAGIDATIVNVALPSIQQDLHAPVSGLQWVVDAYTVVIASLLILSGSVADRFGRRRVFQIGLAAFTLGSLLCSLAPGLGWLVAFRMLQAVGGSMMNPVAVSIITNTFTDPRERARAIGIWGAVFGLSIAAGPVCGGLLVATVGWRGIFWVNVPIGVAAIVLTALFVPESRAGRARRLDPVGEVLVIALLASLTYAIIEAPRAGWLSPQILALFGVAAAALAGLVIYEPRRAEPLLDLRFFGSVPFTGATLIAVSAFASLGGFLFLNTLYLQEVRGLTALHAGLFTLPLALMTLIFAPLSGRMIGHRGGGDRRVDHAKPDAEDDIAGQQQANWGARPQAGQQQRARGHAGTRHHQRQPGAAAADDPPRQRREDQRHQCQRQREQPGVQRREAAHLLQVQGVQEQEATE